jgi:hypothetical protein
MQAGSVARMRRTLLFVGLMVGLTSVASAQPGGGRPPPPPQQQQWDERGWQLLGEKTVDGRIDRDRIEVGRYEGRFNKLTVRVKDSDLEMIEFKIVFGDNTEYNPKVSQFFRENTRTKVIELPPAEQIIRYIDFKYRNLPGGGRATIQVYGFKIGDTAGKPQPRPPVVNWDSKGWTLLGSRDVDGRVDRDRIEVGRYEGKFTKLTIVVRDSDLELIDFGVKFARGPEWKPNVAHYFRENQRTRVIDFPGDERVIKHIDFTYRNLPGGGRAKVEVWAQKGGDAPRPPVTVNWDSRGWTMLGARDVDGRVDRDRIEVGRYEGRFSKLTIVVRDSDLELIDLGVKFARGPEWKPKVAHYFRENQRTHVIDFPGDERVIKHIDFTYRNLPGGGRAKVEVWAWKTDGTSAQTNKPTWDDRGWTMLGEQKVGGGRRGDRDRIQVGRDEGKFRQITIVVLDSDIELYDVKVKFGRGPVFDPQIKSAVFREGTRTRVIDLPGDRRVIKNIEFAYRNLPGGGNARVQVWGK